MLYDNFKNCLEAYGVESLFIVSGVILFVITVIGWYCLYVIRRDLKKGHEIDVNVQMIFGAFAVVATASFVIWIFIALVFPG